MTERVYCICGIDPGQTGAISFYFPTEPGRISVHDMPIAGKELDGFALADRLKQLRPDLIVIEGVHSMPKQGVASTFKLGENFGGVKAVCGALGLTTMLVTPGKWKAHFGLTADKEQGRALAIRLWPASEHFKRKKDHGRAEAALIARYGAEVLLPKMLGAAA